MIDAEPIVDAAECELGVDPGEAVNFMSGASTTARRDSAAWRRHHHVILQCSSPHVSIQWKQLKQALFCC